MSYRLLTSDDWKESLAKFRQRGAHFLLSKFSPDSRKRTRSAFDDTNIDASNWWMIPQVQQRWNQKISGDPQINISQYVVEKYLNNRSPGRLLSIGCGTATHELHMAQLAPQWQFVGIDIAPRLVEYAQKAACASTLTNIDFFVLDVTRNEIPNAQYDIVFFHSSLHHFPNIYRFLEQRIIPVLKENGLIIIFEFTGPNRLQFPREQLQTINQLLRRLPTLLRRRYKSNLVKNKVSGPGFIRMLIADPSECADSASILPSLHALLTIVEEKPIGDNLLMLLLKDIAHHFTDGSPTVITWLEWLFQQEDKYLQSHPADFVFGVYKKGTG